MRLIDADAYIAEMHNRQEAAEDWIKSSTGANQIRAKATFLAYCEAALTLKNMPTIDAVPVVRCRDCKYSDTFPDGADNDMPLKCLSIRYGGVYPDWYCEHGKRKDDDENG